MRSLRRSMAPLLRAAAVHRLLPHHNPLFTSCRSTSTFLRTPSPSANESSALSCSGCGVSLQSSDATSLGYYKQPVKQPETAANSVEVPEDGRKWAPPLAVICQRCHRAKHYGNLVPVTLPYKAFEATLRSIARRPDACLLVVLDVLDVHSSMCVRNAHGLRARSMFTCILSLSSTSACIATPFAVLVVF